MRKSKVQIISVLFGCLVILGPSCKSAQIQDDITFNLAEPLYLDGKNVVSISKMDIPKLRQKTLSTSSLTPVFLGLTEIDGSVTTVRTIDEYLHEIERGAYANTTLDMVIEDTIFKNANIIFNLLEKARPIKTSYISEHHVGIMNFDLLPSSLFLTDMTDDEGVRELEKLFTNETSVSAILKQIRAIRVKETSNCVIFEIKQFIFRLCEITRSDFNSDGIEDILISEE